MGRVILLIFFVLTQHFVAAQGQTVDHDSLRRAMDKHMQEYRERREVYLNQLRDSPRETLDSVREAKIEQFGNEGLLRLESLAQNDRLDTLKIIDLSFAHLTEIPTFIFKAKNVEKLILDYNHIKKLPKELAELKKLKSIFWRYNRLQDFWWVGIKRNDQLEKLDISNNNLTRVPLGIRKIGGLTTLILDRNLFDKFPINRLAKAESVRNVSMNQCEWIEITDGKYEKLSFIKSLKLNNSRLDTLPKSFYAMTGLEELQLLRNNLTLLPHGISGMKNLKKLSLYKNELTDLPHDFFELDELQVVDLYYNQLTVIPEAIQHLKKLKILYLAHNRVYSLPENIGLVNELEELYLHHNQLSALPAGISALQELEVIRVNDNFLMEFPSQILGLDSLMDIDISNNQIATIPPEIINFKKLRLFSYNDNQIDFNVRKNQELASVLFRMGEKGVICVPRVSKEIIRED